MRRGIQYLDLACERDGLFFRELNSKVSLASRCHAACQRAFLRPSVSPAFDRTTCASIDLLMLDEQTTPNDSLDCSRPAEAGGIPGGVDGLSRSDDMADGP